MSLEYLSGAIEQALESMSWIEVVAVVAGVSYLLLATKEIIWCWLFGLINVIAYLFICFQSKLYAEFGLQVFYFFITLYGWYQWKFGGKNNSKEEISFWPLKTHLLVIGSGALATLILATILESYTDADIPLLDSFTTVFSVICTYMVAKKKIENWLYWIIVDSAAAYMYFYKELYLTSLLFVLYVILVIFGYYEWKRLYKVQQASQN